MKSKAILTAVLLAATNFAWANGGLSIDATEDNGYRSASNNQPEIVVQGPTNQFDVALASREQYVVDTNQFKQSNDGKS